ncbi:MAG: hypothetical protein HYY46_16870 [Deltaproteobacteria bacterium]|nr:hypothetical protein [Deltaproteobacteria bacterium]
MASTVMATAPTIVDAEDPADPPVVRQIPHPPNTHAHKVQNVGDILIQNQERPYFGKKLRSGSGAR